MTEVKISYYDRTGRACAHEFWKNFVGHIHQTTKPQNELYNYIQIELAQYNAKMAPDGRGMHILFENDCDATVFLLRWS